MKENEPDEKPGVHIGRIAMCKGETHSQSVQGRDRSTSRLLSTPILRIEGIPICIPSPTDPKGLDECSSQLHIDQAKGGH